MPKTLLRFGTSPFRLSAFLVVLSLLATGCVERGNRMTPTQRQRLRQWVGRSAPKAPHRLDVRFGEAQVALIGYEAKFVAATKVNESDAIEVTWFWQALRPLDEGWRLFTHITNDEGSEGFNGDSVGVIRELYPPSMWQKGEYIRDTQRIALPPEWSSSRAKLYVGLWKGDERMKIARGKDDGERRVLAAALDTPRAPSKGASEVPRLEVMYASGNVVIDGKLDDALWTKAPSTDALLDPQGGGGGKPEARVQAAWDERFLYLAFKVREDDLRSPFQKHDDHLWEADCVEALIDPDGDGKNYFEIQVSPQGIVFDTQHTLPRTPAPFGVTDWQSELQAKVALEGSLNDTQSDKGYVVEAAIPWKSFRSEANPSGRPKAGETWRANFFVMDNRPGGQMYASAWSPPLVGDFHVPARFGTLAFAGKP